MKSCSLIKLHPITSIGIERLMDAVTETWVCKHVYVDGKLLVDTGIAGDPANGK